MQIVYNTFTDDFDYVGTGSGPSTDDLHVARFIVSAGGATDGANYTTLALAYAAAVSAGGKQTIFLQPGTYNIGTQALSPNINIAAFDCDALTPNVTISGKMTANITGNCSFSGINFLNNTDSILSVSGTGVCNFKFTECFINVSGNAPAFLNTNANAGIQVFSSKGDISGTDTYFDMTGGNVDIQDTFFFNNIQSLTTNIFSNASFDLESSTFDCPIVSTGAGGDVSIKHSTMILLDALLISTSGGPNSDLIILNSYIDSNNATAIDIGSGSTMTIANSAVGSTATNAITGAGVLLYTPIAFTKSSSKVTVATQTPLRFGPQISPELADTNGTVYYDGTIILTADPGTAGEIWTSNGAGSPPSFQAAGGGGSSTYFQAYRTTNQTVAGGSISDTIIFDTAISNVGSAYNTSTGIFTAPATGFYAFASTVNFGNLTIPAGLSQVILAYTGSVQSLRLEQFGLVPATTGASLICTASWAMPMAAGDTVKMQPFADGAGNYVIAGTALSSGSFSTSSTFSGFRVA